MYSSNQLSVNEKKALALARTQITTSIKASNPHYFEDFKASIQTVNPVLIKEKLIEVLFYLLNCPTSRIIFIK